MKMYAPLKLEVLLALACLFLSMGCSDDSTSEKQTGDVAIHKDAGDASDAAAEDTDSEDVRHQDTHAEDIGSQDGSPQDTGSPDASSPDAGSPDSGTADAGAEDAGSRDTGEQDAADSDTGATDAGAQDTGADIGPGCTPGDSKEVDCNTCACNPQGVWVCTKRACPGGNYKPCGGKACGDRCTICDPADPNCVETAVVKYCDDQENCSPQNSPQCSI